MNWEMAGFSDDFVYGEELDYLFSEDEGDLFISVRFVYN